MVITIFLFRFSSINFIGQLNQWILVLVSFIEICHPSIDRELEMNRKKFTSILFYIYIKVS